jgi:DNA-binding protein YbaB
MELDPGPAQTLALLGKFQSAMEGQMNQMAGGEYKASDTEKSVDVTLNGYQWLTKLCIQPGLLKEIGADGVAARVNEALQNAQQAASAYNEVAGEQLVATLDAISKAIINPPPV